MRHPVWLCTCVPVSLHSNDLAANGSTQETGSAGVGSGSDVSASFGPRVVENCAVPVARSMSCAASAIHSDKMPTSNSNRYVEGLLPGSFQTPASTEDWCSEEQKIDDTANMETSRRSLLSTGQIIGTRWNGGLDRKHRRR